MSGKGRRLFCCLASPNVDASLGSGCWRERFANGWRFAWQRAQGPGTPQQARHQRSTPALPLPSKRCKVPAPRLRVHHQRSIPALPSPLRVHWFSLALRQAEAPH